MEILNLLNLPLLNLLMRVLPSIDNDWWIKLVLNQLTFQQKSVAQQLPEDALEKLDLAALLRITDQNWYDINQEINLGKDARNWLKEAQTIRNRWAHAPADGLHEEIYYRDLDTIERLLQAFGADESTLRELKQAKQQSLAKLAGATQTISAIETVIAQFESQFRPGDVIRLKAKPKTTGAIIKLILGETEDRYQVFQDGAMASYFASQIELLPTIAPTDSHVALDQLHAALSALQLRHPSTNHLYSLRASRINFVPYQFRPVLKLIQADRPRLLIADEVGVGKTIEAGLILKELQARRELKNVLVICPKPLVAERKWQQEMKRFDERFSIWTA